VPVETPHLRESFDLAGRRVWVAGHRGMVGSALVRRLASENCTVLTSPRAAVDLRRQDEVEAWMTRECPDVVVIAAAKVGGIAANSALPADFLYDNLAIQTNIIRQAAVVKIDKLLFLGSSCIYPKFAAQPITEDSLLTGPLEPTNEWYAIAKIAGIRLAQAYRRQHGCDFISAMPTNLYGPGDNYHPEHSHVMAALLRRTHEAKLARSPELVVWGSGTPRREFMHVDDLADGIVFLLKHYSAEQHINIGTGEDLSIAELAGLLSGVIGYTGTMVFDRSKPDGTPRKLMDGSRLGALGWRSRIALRDGIGDAYHAFLATAEQRAA